MMWGDMFFALTGQDYHSEEGVDASQLKQVPEDLSLIYWDYYADRRETYEFNLRQMGKLSPELTFAGGSWKWSGYAPEMLHSLKVSRLALSACRQFGVKRVFATAWGDNGGDASIYAALPGIQLFAELGFHENVTEEELASRFAVCTGGRLEDFLRLDLPNLPDGQPKSLGFNPAKYLFFQDPMVGLFDRHAALGFDAFYRDTAAALHEAAERAGRYAHVFRVLEAMCSALALKATVGIRLKQAYEADDRQELLRLAEEVLPGNSPAGGDFPRLCGDAMDGGKQALRLRGAGYPHRRSGDQGPQRRQTGEGVSGRRAEGAGGAGGGAAVLRLPPGARA